ncbi:MAG: insulinase family protein [Cyclobacteriaceae bacterium]
MVDRTVSPPAEKISKPKFPETEIEKTDTGIELVTLSQHSQPAVMVDLVFPVGRSTENVLGITYFASKMLLEGTVNKSSSDIANELDYYGSHLEITPTLDHIFVRLYCLKKFFENQVSLVFELIKYADFPPKEFEKLKTIRIQQIKQQHAKSNAFAGLKYRERLFGSAHPYGRIVGIEDTQNISLEEVKEFYHNKFLVLPTVFLAGAVGSEEIDFVKRELSAINFIDKGDQSKFSANPENGITINWENSVQSSIRFGDVCISKSHPDIHKLKISNELLGGFFGSRLMKNIREEKGLTYGIGSNIVHLDQGNYWVIGTDVLKEKADLAISEIRKEIEILQNTPPSLEEIHTLKSYIQGKWLMSFDSVFNSMNLITNNYLAGLTNQYWVDLMTEVDSITPEQVSETLKKHFNLDSAIEVLVG